MGVVNVVEVITHAQLAFTHVKIVQMPSSTHHVVLLVGVITINQINV
jgi:hypothetical protein